MEKYADRVENILEENLYLYRELEDVFEQERQYIMDMDVESLWKIVAQKKQITSKLERLSNTIGQMIETRAEELGRESDRFYLSDFIKTLPISRDIKANLRKIQWALKACQKTVSELALANKTYINESLGVMNDLFSMVLNVAGQKEYSKSGCLLANKENNRLFKAEV